jgi:PIN domain nuclease of toxin-antitoxin system
VIERNGFALSGISMEAGHLVSEMPYIHRDPFDRMIFAHAKSSQYRLLYTDPVFKKYEAYYHE